MSKNTKNLTAVVTAGEGGRFRAVASTGSIDRDGEVIVPGAFAASRPLPDTVPVHLGHPTNPGSGASTLVGRARPFYEGGRLMIDGWFTSTTAGQTARQLVAEGVLDSVSVMFTDAKRESRDGIVHIVSAELLSVDLVSIPSNRDALVISARAMDLAGAGTLGKAIRLATAETQAAVAVAFARAEAREARALLRKASSTTETPDRTYQRSGFTVSTAEHNGSK